MVSQSFFLNKLKALRTADRGVNDENPYVYVSRHMHGLCFALPRSVRLVEVLTLHC